MIQTIHYTLWIYFHCSYGGEIEISLQSIHLQLFSNLFSTLEAVKSHLGGDEAKLEAKIKELKAEIGEEKMKEIERARQ
eukprot:1210819-Amorphochlora_amoeboformis.AAC.1